MTPSPTPQHKVQISNLQFFMLMIIAIVPYGHFVYVHLSYIPAGRDAWFSLICGFLIGFFVMFFLFQLAKHYPNQSLIQILKQVYGTQLGTFLSLLYVLFFCFVAALTASELAQFTKIIYPTTPVSMFLFAEFFLVAWVARAGLEVAARATQLLLPGLAVLGLTAALLSLPDKDPRQLLPILDHSFGSLAQGSLIYVMMFSEVIVFGMFLHKTTEPQLLRKQWRRTWVILFIMFIGPITGPIMVFGEKLAQELAFPTYTEIQFIHLSGIIERLDVLGIMLWTIGSFLRISIFTIGAARGLKDIADEKGDANFVFPVILLTIGLTFSMAPLAREDLHEFVLITYPMIPIVMGYLLPAFSLFIAFLRGYKTAPIK